MKACHRGVCGGMLRKTLH